MQKLTKTTSKPNGAGVQLSHHSPGDECIFSINLSYLAHCSDFASRSATHDQLILYPPKKERVIRSTCKILFYVKKGREKPSGNLPSMYRLTANGEIEQFGYKKNVPLRSWDVKNNRRRTTSKRRKSILQWTKSAWKYAAVTNNRHKTRYVPSDRQGKTQKKRRYKL